MTRIRIQVLALVALSSTLTYAQQDNKKGSQLYTLMYQSKNKLILYYQLQGNNKTDLSAK